MKILVSSCLLGQNVRYDASSNKVDSLDVILQNHEVFAFCPEIEGGLLTPRDPAEIKGTKVLSKNGLDLTKEFEKGALNALHLCKKNNISLALLKAKSPSCGNIKIYDGNFTNTLINGSGICAKLLIQNGIKVFNELELELLIEELF